ncbi:hypothetical protein [Streptomyces avidinii]|uniref:Uncharacterized protein n=1 Tax=Streptomyces avidinii TaxID=1895 RepID=A0ABS4L3X1_STRAV|nr:hypothetical protein [Streptomyces avidinii]MBP2036795.1 hypothetical protein [Streptomyces avidinii]
MGLEEAELLRGAADRHVLGLLITGQYAAAEVTTGAPGTVDHTIDTGLYINRL